MRLAKLTALVITEKLPRWRLQDNQVLFAKQKWVKTQLIIDVKTARADLLQAHVSLSLAAL